MDAATFAALTQEEQVQRIERLGRAALREFGVEPRSIEPLVHAENTTYRVNAEEGSFCLRVCRPGYQSDSNIASEIVFLGALSDAGFDVPKPHRGRVVKVSVPEVPEARNCVLLHWQAGDFANERFSPAQAEAVGGAMAKMHRFAASWSPPAGFDRQKLHQKIGGPLLFESHPDLLRGEDRALLIQILEQSRSMLARLEASPETFGLIHGDLHRGNVLFDGGSARIIDFDDLGRGYWIADFAAALAYETGKEGYEEVQQAMLDGYRAILPLPPQTEELLPYFLRMRFMTIVDWCLSRLDNPRMRETAEDWIVKLVAGIRSVA